MRHLWIVAGLFGLIACGSSETDPPGPESVELPNGFTLTTEGCLEVDNHPSTSMTLTGRLVVTHFVDSMEGRECFPDEENDDLIWCPFETQVEPSCEEEEGTFWCRGDGQELGLLDLSNPEAGITRWTHNMVHEAELDVSPDGSQVVYAQRSAQGQFDGASGLGIWLIDIDGSNARQVTDSGVHSGIPTWVPPMSTQFTFISEGLMLFDTQTSSLSTIQFEGFEAALAVDPEASHDASMIVFKAAVDTDDEENYAVYIADFDGSGGRNVRALTRESLDALRAMPGSSGASDHDPVFSHDNQRIYIERYLGTGQWNAPGAEGKWAIIEIDAQTGAETTLIPHDPCGKHYWWLPTISPDGQQLMFIHDFVDEAAGTGYQDLWVSNIDGTNAQQVPGTDTVHWFDWTR